MAKLSKPSDDQPMEFYEQLSDIINDVPTDILNSEGDGDEDEAAEEGDESEEKTEDEVTESDKDEKTESEDDEGEESDEDDDDDDDYFTSTDEAEDDKTAKTVASVDIPAAPSVTQTDESKFILDNLSKISVNVIVEGSDGKDVIQAVSVYGYGDLPTNFKGYANPREGELFRGAVTAQELKAQQLQTQYQQTKQQNDIKKASEEYTVKENKAIAEDLTELRREGIFPHFKGNPGTKEFNDSEGAKEFDKTVAFMNKKNDEYVQRANTGKNYRHIGFREAYEMLHGQNPKAAEQAEDRARKKIAGKVVSKRGARAQTIKTGAARVNNLTDLADEFQAAVSN